MNNTQRILLFFVLPIIAPLLYPPALLQVGGLLVIGFEVILFLALGFALLRGSSTALTLSIFLQGLNVIVRLMMFFPHATTQAGTWDIAYVITSLLSMGISTYILLRLDRIDVRTQMVH
jgi:hypothetical protein